MLRCSALWAEAHCVVSPCLARQSRHTRAHPTAVSRLNEYQNLIKAHALEEVAPTPGALALYLTNAKNYLDSSKQIDQSLSMQVFTCAYEGYFQLVQAVLEFYQVRAKDAGRNLVIQRVSSDLKMSAAEFSLISKAHSRRNATSYQSPFPPVSKAEAEALVGILEKYLPEAYKLTGIPLP